MFYRIKTKILAAQIAVTIVAVLLSGLVAYKMVRGVIVELRTKNLSLLAYQVGVEVRAVVDGIESAFNSLASKEVLEVFTVKQQFPVLVKHLREQGESFTLISYINAKGEEELRIKNGNLAATGSWDLSAPPLATAMDKPGQTIVHLQDQSAFHLRLVKAQTNFFDEFLGLMVADHPLDRIYNILNAYSSTERSADAALIFRNGRILASTRQGLPPLLPRKGADGEALLDAILAGAPETGRIVLPDGEYMVATTAIGRLPWSVAILMPVDVFFKEQDQLRNAFLAILVGLTLSTTLVAFWLSGLITTRLARMSATVSRIIDGDPREVIEVQGHDEVADLARAFNIVLQTQRTAIEELAYARRRADSASLAKGEFLARMSHEIRTPLNAIIGMTDISLQSDLNDELRGWLETVKDSTVHLLGLINNVLDYSKIEADKMELAPIHFDLKRNLDSVVRMLDSQASAKGLLLDLAVDRDVPGHLYGDAARLRQVLINLVGNAIKFTSRGSITVRVSTTDKAAKRDEDSAIHLRFDVEDTGAGIPPEEVSRLFNAFTQAAGTQSELVEGTGLGLAISKQLVVMMGGEIWMRSEPGKGSVFSFTAEFEPGDPESIEQQQRPDTKGIQRATAKHRILVAEDNPINVKVAKSLLVRMGHDPTFASDGLEAIDLLAKQSFDLVLMDLDMPNLKGIEATQRIRQGAAGPEKRDVPIIALTAHAFSEQKAECLQAGMNDFISKPIDFQQLLVVIRRVMEGGAAPENAASRPREHRLFDRRQALEALLGNVSLHEDICRHFLAHYPSKVERIRQALDEGDIETVRFQAHAIRGNAGNIGARQAMSVATELEMAAKDGDTDRVKTLFTDLEDCLEKTRQAILEEQDELDNEPSGDTP